MRNITSFILNYLPKILNIIVILVVTRYARKMVKVFFTEIELENIKFESFDKDWARPTFKLIVFLFYAVALVMIFPYLPGSSSPAFKGLSVFLGVLISFGSGSSIANIISGIVLTYMRPFRLGDRVKIADTVGDVTERNFLITRINTIKNVEITIPNSMVLNSHIINYSANTRPNAKGLILNTTVTIGYDAPWKVVHELLTKAALGTDLIDTTKPPFVFQTALNDFYVAYEINAFTNHASQSAKIYSELHRNIQDHFNQAGVEIMSPHYSSLRDGNTIAIPPEYRAKEYLAPAFKLSTKNSEV